MCISCHSIGALQFVWIIFARQDREPLVSLPPMPAALDSKIKALEKSPEQAEEATREILKAFM